MQAPPCQTFVSGQKCLVRCKIQNGCFKQIHGMMCGRRHMSHQTGLQKVHFYMNGGHHVCLICMCHIGVNIAFHAGYHVADTPARLLALPRAACLARCSLQMTHFYDKLIAECQPCIDLDNACTSCECFGLDTCMQMDACKLVTAQQQLTRTMSCWFCREAHWTSSQA